MKKTKTRRPIFTMRSDRDHSEYVEYRVRYLDGIVVDTFRVPADDQKEVSLDFLREIMRKRGWSLGPTLGDKNSGVYAVEVYADEDWTPSR